MTAREIVKMEETKRRLYLEQFGRCSECAKPLNWAARPQLAHIIPKTKANIAKYGKEYIHHVLNLRLVCSLKCNAAVAIGQKKLEEARLMEQIKAEITK